MTMIKKTGAAVVKCSWNQYEITLAFVFNKLTIPKWS